MGMFDWLKCEYPLPKNLEGVSHYQTKSFHNAMENYRISEEGYLYHTPYKEEFVEEEDRPFFGTKQWETQPISQLFGMTRQIPQPEVRIYYSGGINFYWYDVIERISHDFNSIFLDGKLVDVKYTLKKWLRE